ncbi:MAG: hypothetical protein LW832_06805 [Parachlamydia sp.]|jgi:hypothetical protein|nr:hypothetical protein [Parachlamydia sp.]
MNMDNLNHYIEKKWTEFEPTWNYYTQDRAVFHGLPLSSISCIACAILFNQPGLIAAGLFGAAHCAVYTPFIEYSRLDEEIGSQKQALLFTVSYFVSKALLQTFCKIPLSHSAALPLAFAAIGGQMFRYYTRSSDLDEAF